MVGTRQRIQNLETDVVPVIGIFGSRIAQTHDQVQ
jgi:hypothetical protein